LGQLFKKKWIYPKKNSKNMEEEIFYPSSQ